MPLDTIDAASVLDVRRLPCELRRATIIESFDALEPGQAMEIINSFDPVPLRQHFEARTLVGFSWDYLEQGPDIWRIRLTRR
jgi:uncharacterized protein (DUF2249 family)